MVNKNSICQMEKLSSVEKSSVEKQSTDNKSSDKESKKDDKMTEYNRIIKRYPDKIPIILTMCEQCTNLPPLVKNKYIVPKDISIAQFLFIIRKKLNINESMAIFFFCKKKLIPTSKKLEDIYDEYKEDNGFVYFEYTSENTFG